MARSRFFNGGYRVSIEDAGLDALPGGNGEDGVGDAPRENEEPEDTFAEDIMEVNDASDAIADTDDQVDELNEASEALESIVLSLESTLGNRGLDATGAMFLNHSVRIALKPLGIANPVGSVESFGNTGNRIRVTKVSLEGIKETISDIWKWLKKVLENARRAMNDYWQKFFGAAGKMKARAEAMAEKARKLSKAAANKKIEVSSGLAQKLHVAKKVDLSATFLSNIKTNADALFVNYPKAAGALATALIDGAENIEFEEDTIENKVTEFVTAAVGKAPDYPPCSKDVTAGDKRYEANAAATKTTEELPGGMMIVQVNTLKKDDDKQSLKDKMAAIGAYSLTLTTFSEKKVEMSDVTIATPVPNQIAEFADQVADVCAVIERYKKSDKDVDNLKKDALRAADRVEKSVKSAKELPADETALGTGAFKLLGKVPGIIDQPAQRFSQYVLTVCGSLLSVCDKAMAEYK